MTPLQYIDVNHFKLHSGHTVSLQLSYQVFGKSLGTAPIVLVNHALTGNSQVTGENGWWNAIVGSGRVIDTESYTVLAFNSPGNGFGNNPESFSEIYKNFVAKDIAGLFAEGLHQLQITTLFAVIGGSVGGGIAWELAVLKPKLIEHIIPVATDWKATDSLIANCFVQERILENSVKPLQDARIHAMTFYRTPESLTSKFSRTRRTETLFNVESWLNYHGEKLSERFQVTAYKMMNQILKTINVANNNLEFQNIAKNIKGDIHIITINSDLLFKPEENWNTFIELKQVKDNVTIGEIKSIHGHDAFLIEYQQLSKLLKPIFNQKKDYNDNRQLNHIWNR